MAPSQKYLVAGSKSSSCPGIVASLRSSAEKLTHTVVELKKENGDLRLMMQTLEEKIDKVAASRQ